MIFWTENWDRVIFIDQKDLIYMGQMAGNFSSIASKDKNIFFAKGQGRAWFVFTCEDFEKKYRTLK